MLPCGAGSLGRRPGVVQASAALVQDAHSENSWSQVATDLVADGVADDGCRDHQQDYQPEVHLALAGDHATEDGSGFAG